MARKLKVSLTGKSGTITKVAAWVNNVIWFSKPKSSSSVSRTVKGEKATVEFQASGVKGSTAEAKVVNTDTGKELLKKTLTVGNNGTVEHEDEV